MKFICFLTLAITLFEVDSSPNIVLIYADDVGYGDFQSYGHPTQERGAVDDLAREGTRFTQWYSSAFVCTPSRAALLTGKLPVRTGIWGKRLPVFIHGDSGGLPKSEVTIAEALRDKAGYETGMVGKWHLGINEFEEGDGNHLPHHHGFDFVGTLIPYTHDWPCDPRHFSVEQMKDVCFLYYNDTIVEQPYDPTRLAADISADAKAFIRRNHRPKRDGDEGKPFFLYYSLPHAHSAMICSKQFCNSSKRGPYGDNINELSWMVGEVVDTLKELRIADNTLVLFLSDHGPQVGLCGHGGSTGVLKGMKLTNWEGGIRVPAIAWWPGSIPAGVVNDQVVSTLDVFDTLLDVAGVAPTKDDAAERDGKSIREVLLGATTDEGPMKEVHEILYFYCNDVLSAVRLGRYKIHYRTRRIDEGKMLKNCAGTASNPRRNLMPAYDCSTLTPHQPPLVYDLNTDPAERFPLPPGRPVEVLERAEMLVRGHRAGLVVAPSQFDTFDKRLRPCCDPPSCVCSRSRNATVHLRDEL